jgi:hypothetical protein
MRQLMIGVSGSFDVILDVCSEKTRFDLSRSYRLYVSDDLARTSGFESV